MNWDQSCKLTVDRRRLSDLTDWIWPKTYFECDTGAQGMGGLNKNEIKTVTGCEWIK